MYTPSVSIITINYNQAEVTCALLRSLRDVTYPRMEVIVVDNGSANDEAATIQAAHPEVRVLPSPVNGGFTGGNNLGMRAATGDYVLLLNNDTEVPAGFLEPLVDVMERRLDIGIASPKIYYYDVPDCIQYAGSTPFNYATGRSFTHGHGTIDTGKHNTSGPTAIAHGAAMLIRRAVLDRIGLLDDTFFIYYEELDFCERAQKAGYTIWYEAASWIWHKESMTTGKVSPFKTYYMTRNRLLLLRRHASGWTFLAGLLFFLGLAIPRQILRQVRHRRFDLLRALLRGFTWHLTRPRYRFEAPHLTALSPRTTVRPVASLLAV